MKILVVQESDWLLRGPHQQHHLMERLALKGHEIHVIDYEILWRTKGKRELFSRRQLFENVSRFYEGANVTVVRPGIMKIPCLDKWSILLSHRDEIERQIDEFKPDVIVGFGILNTYLAMKSAKKHEIPFIYYLIDALHRLVPFEPFQLIAKEFEKKTLKDADKVLTINAALRDYAVQLGADPKKVSVLEAGIDPDLFHPSVDGSKIREKYGIGQHDFVLFFMGWLYPFSGLWEVASELVKLKDEHPSIKLLIVGEGDLLDKLKVLRDKYCCRECLILMDRQPYERIPEYIAASDICLLPAYDNDVMRYIVPIKMYEYMACGKPVIATKLLGIMKEFREGNGVVYVDRPEDVLERAIALAKDRKAIKEIGIKAVKYVQKYSWESITDKFEIILKDQIKKHV